VECPSLPGCLSQGKTREEAIQNIREAIRGYVAALEEDGLPVPAGVKTPLSPLGERVARPGVLFRRGGPGEGAANLSLLFAAHNSPVKKLGKDHAASSTFSTNSSGASRTMPFGNRVTAYPIRLSSASRLASRLVWLGCA